MVFDIKSSNTFPVPSADSLYKPLGLALVPSGTDIYYQVSYIN